MARVVFPGSRSDTLRYLENIIASLNWANPPFRSPAEVTELRLLEQIVSAIRECKNDVVVEFDEPIAAVRPKIQGAFHLWNRELDSLMTVFSRDIPDRPPEDQVTRVNLLEACCQSFAGRDRLTTVIFFLEFGRK